MSLLNRHKQRCQQNVLIKHTKSQQTPSETFADIFAFLTYKRTLLHNVGSCFCVAPIGKHTARLGYTVSDCLTRSPSLTCDVGLTLQVYVDSGQPLQSLLQKFRLFFARFLTRGR